LPGVRIPQTAVNAIFLEGLVIFAANPRVVNALNRIDLLLKRSR
jgi:hypothetical protein